MPYETMMYAGMASTAVFLTVAIVIFIQLDIRSVIEDLTGMKARKAIHRIESAATSNTTGNVRLQNEKVDNQGETGSQGRKFDNGKKNRNILNRRGRQAFYMHIQSPVKEPVTDSLNNSVNQKETVLLKKQVADKGSSLLSKDNQSSEFVDATKKIERNRTAESTVLLREISRSNRNHIDATVSLQTHRRKKHFAMPPSGAAFQIIEHVVIVHTEETI